MKLGAALVGKTSLKKKEHQLKIIWFEIKTALEEKPRSKTKTHM